MWADRRATALLALSFHTTMWADGLAAALLAIFLLTTMRASLLPNGWDICGTCHRDVLSNATIGSKIAPEILCFMFFFCSESAAQPTIATEPTALNQHKPSLSHQQKG